MPFAVPGIAEKGTAHAERHFSRMTRYWLFKSEPDTYGLEHLRRDGVTPWSGVRSYQARNNMLEMKLGDQGFFYHSSTAQPGAFGICEVVKEAYPDFTAFERGGEYYDPRSKPERPIWQMVDVKFVRALARPVLLAQMRAEPRLFGMELLKKGSRLSVQSVMPHEWNIVLEMSNQPA
ncbi:MAG: EVE domain-containing protein [Candidatus Baltobacteraceae bacterium]